MELIHAFLTAEMVGRSLLCDFLLRVSRYFHPAHRVGEGFFRVCHNHRVAYRSFITMVGVMMRLLTVTCVMLVLRFGVHALLLMSDVPDKPHQTTI